MKNKGKKIGKSALAAALSLSMSLSGLAVPAATTVLADDGAVTPLETLDFNDGLAGYTDDANFEIVKSEQVRYTKVGDEVETGKDLTDANGLVYQGTDENAHYIKTVFSNQPSTSADDVKGTALTLDKTVYADEIVKTKSAKTDAMDQVVADALDTGSDAYNIEENGVAVGKVATQATTSRSQVYFTNPLYNQTADAYTLTYWQYVPTKSTTDTADATNVKISTTDDAALIAFEGVSSTKQDEDSAPVTVPEGEEKAIQLYYDADSTAMTAGEWQQIAVVFTADGATFYVNGKAVEDSYMKVVGGYSLSTITESPRILFGGSDIAEVDTIYNSKLDDVTFYTTALTAEQIAAAYETAAAELSPSVDVNKPLAYYSLSDASQFTDIGTSASVSIEEATVAGKTVNVAHVAANKSGSTQIGLKLNENPFADVDSLEGITIGYWYKQAVSGRNVKITPNFKSLVIADDEKYIKNYKNEEQAGTGRSWLYVSNNLTAYFQEGSDYSVGGYLKNTYSFSLSSEKQTELLTDEGTVEGGANWFYVTLVATNAGIQMYVNGEKYENEATDVYGARFGDGYYAAVDEQTDLTAKYGIAGGTNNQLATQLLTFVGYEDTRLYFSWSISSLVNNTNDRNTESWVYSVSCYDGAMSDEEVETLYAKETGTYVPTEEPTSEPDVRYGDVDNNTIITVNDALLVLKHVVGLTTLTESQQKAADVDGVAEIKVSDALYILKYVVKLIDKFPVEEK